MAGRKVCDGACPGMRLEGRREMHHAGHCQLCQGSRFSAKAMGVTVSLKLGSGTDVYCGRSFSYHTREYRRGVVCVYVCVLGVGVVAGGSKDA